MKEIKNIEDGLNDLLSLPIKSAEEALRRACSILPEGSITVASSFSLEDVVIIDIIAEEQLPIEIFALDTGRLPQETYDVAERIREKYELPIKWYFPKTESVETLVREKGMFSFRDSVEQRKECCYIRKVEPLQRALGNKSAWVTGQRQQQSITRKALELFEMDAANGLIKINPLTTWTSEEVWERVNKQSIPFNRLFKQGYPSIGCAPCTRAVSAGEDERAGRWWWENPEHKECGLHFTDEEIQNSKTIGERK